MNIPAIIATLLLLLLIKVSSSDKKSSGNPSSFTTSSNTNSKTNTSNNKMVTQITSVEQFDQAIKADKLVVVDFYSLTCGPCKMIAPIVEKFAAQYTEADFYKVDCDDLGAAAQSNNISALPTFVFFKGGKEITRVIGANPSGVKSTIAANL